MTKTIALADDAYEELHNLKKPDESFTEVVRRIAKKEKKKSLLEFVGKWEGSKEEMDTIFNKIIEERHRSKIRKVDL